MKNNKIILGIHCAYSHDSGIAVLKNGQILGCLAQERVSRIKKDAAFPFAAIKNCLHIYKFRLMMLME